MRQHDKCLNSKREAQNQNGLGKSWSIPHILQLNKLHARDELYLSDISQTQGKFSF